MNENTVKEKSEKPKYNLWQNSAFMIRLAWKTRKSVLVFVLLTAALTVIQNVAELFITPVILRQVETAVPLPQLLGVIGAFSLLLMLLSGFKEYIQVNSLFPKVDVRTSIIDKLNFKLDTTSYPNTESTRALQLYEKAHMATNSNNKAAEAIWQTLTELIQNVSGFVIYLLLLSSLDPLLIIIVLVTTVFGYLVSKRINEWGYRHRDEEAAYSKQMTYISDHVRDRALAKDIRIFSMRPWLEDMYTSSLRLFNSFIARREKMYLMANVLDVVLSFARNGLAYFFLISMTLSDSLPASSFLLYFSAITGFTNWIMGIMSGLSTLHKQSLDILCIREFLELPEPFRFEGGREIPVCESGAYELCLDHVTFRYPGAAADAFTDLDLTIHPGEKLAIVGLNGAGKTTLVKLLCGFYDPDKGRVLLNGIDIREFNRRDYYKLFTAVFQQFSVLDVTLAQNVAQSIEDIDMDRVKDCVAKAGLTEKVESLPLKYDTHIGRTVYLDGMELSGGQMQRLMLARALYKDAPVIVLDEPTAALDPIAENDIYLKYNEMTSGRTSVFISHRLSSTRFCDRIIFIDKGRIAEEGTHDSLMAQDGMYADLFHIQSKYYQEGSVLDEQ